MIVENLDVEGVAVAPAKDDSPLLVDADRVAPLPGSLQCFQAVARRNSEILQLGRIVKIRKLALGDTDEIRWEPSDGSGATIFEEIFREPIPEALDHVPILSNIDNIGKPGGKPPIGWVLDSR